MKRRDFERLESPARVAGKVGRLSSTAVPTDRRTVHLADIVDAVVSCRSQLGLRAGLGTPGTRSMIWKCGRRLGRAIAIDCLSGGVR